MPKTCSIFFFESLWRATAVISEVRRIRQVAVVQEQLHALIVLVLVDGEAVGAQDDVDGLPLLCTC